jgi:phosphatidylglycerophosphatase A
MSFRFPVAAVLLLVVSFVFFIIWAIMSFVLSVVSDMVTTNPGVLGADGQAAVSNIATMLTTAFGVISLVLFIAGVLAFFFFDTFKEKQDEIFYEQ